MLFTGAARLGMGWGANGGIAWELFEETRALGRGGGIPINGGMLADWACRSWGAPDVVTRGSRGIVALGRPCGGIVSGLGGTPPAGVAATPFEFEGEEVDIGVLSLEPGLTDMALDWK